LENAIKLDTSLQEKIKAVTKASKNSTNHCPPFEIFKTSFRICATGKVYVKTYVIGKISKWQGSTPQRILHPISGFFRNKKLRPAGLAKANIICNNQQYL